MYVPRATYSLSRSFWIVPPICCAGDPLLLGDQLVEAEQDRRGRVDGHRGGDGVEREPGEQQLHVLERVDRHTDLADLALRAGMVRVVAHLGGQVEGAAEPGLAGGQEEVEALVGLRGAAEAGVLAHRPRPGPVHLLVDPAGVGRAAGPAELGLGVELGEVLVRVDGLDLDARVRLARRRLRHGRSGYRRSADHSRALLGRSSGASRSRPGPGSSTTGPRVGPGRFGTGS